MKIAQIAPLYESVPPKGYGGTERVVSYLTEELVRMGHDVTLFASGDSQTSAALCPQVPRSLRTDPGVVDYIAHHVLMTERVFQKAADFDIIHNHIDYFPFSVFRRCETPVLTTLHGRLDLPDLVPIYQEFEDVHLTSISNIQRKPLPGNNWQGTVYHGLPENYYRLNEHKQAYIAFVGRICRDKGIEEAIEAAKRTGIPLKIAAKVAQDDFSYFKAVVEPLLCHPLIEFVGEINEEEKQEFIGNAKALMFMIDWPEPFGLVMIEALACGTPVIARRRGSVPEIIEDQVTGFIVEDIDEGVQALGRIHTIDPKRCREAFEKRFTSKRMAEDYLTLYGNLILTQMIADNL